MNTTTWDMVKRLYHEAGRNITDDLDFYQARGHVFIGDDYFLMGVRVGDGWYVQCAVGDITKFAELMPYHLPYIGWRRQKKHNCEVVWYPTEKILRKVNYARRNTSTTQATSSSH